MLLRVGVAHLDGGAGDGGRDAGELERAGGGDETEALLAAGLLYDEGPRGEQEIGRPGRLPGESDEGRGRGEPPARPWTPAGGQTRRMRLSPLHAGLHAIGVP
jgi:hypothetical protein